MPAGPFRSFGDAAIAGLFQPLATARGLVLAVSGGPDSLALLVLAARWAALGDAPPMSVATVDHGLRPESRGEAEAVAAVSAAFGLVHRLLAWDGPKPAAGLQEAAREARYRLLATAARESGASHVVTAHHRDDQAETVLLRLARGSGIGGLAAMRPFVPLGEGLSLARPLLGVPKASLAAVVAEAGLTPVDDPSNRDPRFARAHLRSHAALLAELGLAPERLAVLAARAARADEALAAVTEERFAMHAEVLRPATAVELGPGLFAEPDEILLRLVKRAVETTGGGALRLERLEALCEGLRLAWAAGQPLSRNLGGSLVKLSRTGRLTVVREPVRHRGRRKTVEKEGA